VASGIIYLIKTLIIAMDSIEMIVQGLVLGEYFMLATHLHDKESARPPQQISNVDEIQPGWWQGKRVSLRSLSTQIYKAFLQVLEVGAGLGLPG